MTMDSSNKYITKASLTAPCPNGCAATTIYTFAIPVRGRNDVYAVGSGFSIIVRYSTIDIGSGWLVNAFTPIAESITNWNITTNGCNKIL